MQVKKNLAFVLALALVSCAALLSWRFAQIYRAELNANLKVNLEKQISTLRLLAEARNREALERQDLLFGHEANLRWGMNRPGNTPPLSEAFHRSSYLALAFLQLGGDGKWHPKWVAASSQVMNWPANFIEELLPTLPLARVSWGQLDWSRIGIPSGQSAIALLSMVEIKASDKKESGIVLGVLPLQHLADITETFRGDQQEAFVTDDKGYALAIAEQKYLGAKLDQHSLVSHILKGQAVKGLADFEDALGFQRTGLFEKVNKSNLVVALSQPSITSWSALQPFLFQVGIVTLACFVLFGFFLFAMGRRFINGYEFLRTSILALATEQPLRHPVNCPPDFAELKLALDSLQGRKPPESKSPQENKNQSTDNLSRALNQVGGGVIQALKGPLTAILGHAQLARSKANDSDLKQHFVVIERESRQARDILDNLTRIVQPENHETRRVELSEVTLAAIGATRDQLTEAGIQIHKQLSPNVLIMANQEQLKVVIEELIRNAIEAMQESTTKEIKISDEMVGASVRLIVEDKGRGLKPEDLAKVFEPFYSTKSGIESAGLGLTMAKRIVKSFNGHIYAESNEGVGSKFVLEFPLASSDRLNRVKERELESQKVVSDESPKAIDLTPSPVPVKAPYESQSVAELSGMKPLVGSPAEALPTPPASDEVTFVGLALEEESAGQEEEWTLTNNKNNNETVMTAKAPAPAPKLAGDGDLSVTIRRPKVKVNT